MRGRPLSENRIYAQELGISYRRLLRLGGAKWLKARSPEQREVIVWPKGNRPHRWGLEARGMTVCKPFSVQKIAEYEALVQKMLRERNLIK